MYLKILVKYVALVNSEGNGKYTMRVSEIIQHTIFSEILSQNKIFKRAGGLISVVEHLHCRHEAKEANSQEAGSILIFSCVYCWVYSLTLAKLLSLPTAQ